MSGFGGLKAQYLLLDVKCYEPFSIITQNKVTWK